MSLFRKLFFSRHTISFIERHPLAVLLGIVAYILLPIDLLPEALIGPLGAFDDVLAAIAGVAILKTVAHRRRVAPSDPAPARPRPSQSMPTVEPRAPREVEFRHKRRGRRGRGGRRPD